MFDNTQTLAYAGGTPAVTKINQDAYSSEYYLDDSANYRRFKLSLKHTIPARGKAGESHLARLDVEHYDSTTEEYKRTSSAWLSIKTFDGVQDTSSSEDVAKAIVAFCSDANIAKLVQRQS